MKIQLEARQKLMLGATAAAVGLVLLARYLYVPLLGWIGSRRARLQELRVKIADAQTVIDQRPVQEAALAKAQADYDTLKSWMASRDSLARILEALSAQAQSHRLELTAVQPRSEQDEVPTISVGPDTTLREIPVRLTLVGRYAHLGDFLGELAASPFLSAVRELTITQPDPGSGKLTAELVLVVYLEPRA
jgi:Tfp pilus assembly protein PilO